MKFFKIFFSFILLFNFYACSESSKIADNNNEKKDSLFFVRETNSVFKIPESVKFDKKNDNFYVSNINGNPSSKDGNGFISKMSADGNITNLKWVTGLNAPKGMGIFGDKLYVADIDELVEISIPEERIIKKYSAIDAEFLNDVDVDKDGNVYVSDTANGKIFMLKNGNFNFWISVSENEKPNGLFCEDERLLIGTKNKIVSVDFKTKKIQTLIDNTGNIDGLESTDTDKYIFSDWNGHIYGVSVGEQRHLLLNTAKDSINAADIEFVKDEKLIAVPTFYHNSVSFYKLQSD